MNKNLIIIGIIALILFTGKAEDTCQSVGCSSVVGMETSGTTTMTDGHSHIYNIDANGNGLTSTNDGHFHEIYNFVIMEKDGHTHQLAR